MLHHLGKINLLSSRFIIGEVEVDQIFTKKGTVEIEALHKWLEFRYYSMKLDRDWSGDSYYSYKRRSIYFLNIIDIEVFKKLTEGLCQSYKREFPYSEEKDFIRSVFHESISFLERFLNLDLIQVGDIKLTNEVEYSFYMDEDDINTEFSDFAIKSEYHMEHYKQYYSQVIKYLQSFKEDKITEQQEINIDNNTTIIKTKQKSDLCEIIDHSRSKEIVQGIKDKYKNIKGKQLKLLLLALQQLNLLSKDRMAKQFHECCKAEFDWDIASYNAMNGHKYNEEIDIKQNEGIETEEIEKKKKFINSLFK